MLKAVSKKILALFPICFSPPSPQSPWRVSRESSPLGQHLLSWECSLLVSLRSPTARFLEAPCSKLNVNDHWLPFSCYVAKDDLDGREDF